MPLTIRGVFTCQGKSTHVRNDQRIHTRIVQLFQIRREGGDLVISRHNVHCHMGLYPVVMGVFHGLRQFLRGEIAGKGPHTEIRSCQIYSVRTVQHRHFQPFHIACGAEQFNLSHVLCFSLE